MDQLPQELVDRVCGYLSAEDLRSTYYVSTKFRKAAEEHAEKHRSRRYTMDFDEETTVEQKQQLINHYSGFRLRYLKEVQFRPYFPDLDTDAPGHRESAEEQREKDIIFTGQILDLFVALKAMEDCAEERNRGKYQLTIYAPSQNRSGDEVCFHWKYQHWRTHLLDPETLPNLMSVASLEIKGDESDAKLDYRIVIDLAIRCQNLERLECHTGMGEWNTPYRDEPAKLFIQEYDGPRRDTRHGLHEATTSTKMPKSLRHVHLDFFSGYAMHEADDIYQWMATPNLVSPAPRDPFSTSIRMISYNLRKLTLQVQAEESLFWPKDGSVPTWPNLEDLFVMFHMVSPSGAWYFEGPRGEGREMSGYEVSGSSYPPLEHTEECESDDVEVEMEGTRSFEDINTFAFRISPNDKVLRPFLTSVAKAAASMPALRRLVLWSPLRWDIEVGEDEEYEAFKYFNLPGNLYQRRNKLAWGLVYSGPRLGWFTENPRADVCNARQVWWRVGEWRPDSELHGLFQRIGRREHGEALKEYWDDDEFGKELVPRNYLEQWTL